MKRKKIIYYVLLISLYILCPNNSAHAVDAGVSSSTGNVGTVGGSGTCAYCDGTTFKSIYQGVRLQVIHAKKSSNKWTFDPYTYPVDIYYDVATAKKTNNINSYAQTRFAYNAKKGHVASIISNPFKTNVDFLTQKFKNNAANPISAWVTTYFTGTDSNCMQNLKQVFRNSSIDSNHQLSEKKIQNICNSVFSNSTAEYYFIDAEPLLVVPGAGKGTLYELIAGNKSGCNITYTNQCNTYVNNGAINNVQQYMPALTKIEKSDASTTYTPFLGSASAIERLKYADWDSDYKNWSGSIKFINQKTIYEKMYGILILSFRGSTKTQLSCSQFEKNFGYTCAQYGKYNVSNYSTKTGVSADKYSTECCETKKTCDTWYNSGKGESCSSGYEYDGHTTSEIAKSKFNSSCCAKEKTSTSCETFKKNNSKDAVCPTGAYESFSKNVDITSKTLYQKNCCKSYTCSYLKNKTIDKTTYKCASDEKYDTSRDSTTVSSNKLSDFQTTCCADVKKTCATWYNSGKGETCETGTYDIEKSNVQVYKDDFTDKCCGAAKICSNVSNISNFCVANDKVYDITKQNDSIPSLNLTLESTRESVLNTCCKEDDSCTYEVKSFNSDQNKDKCCKFFQDENFKNLLAAGKSIEQFKEDFPDCFDGEEIEYSVSTPACDSNPNSSKVASITPKNELTTDNWVNLLKKLLSGSGNGESVEMDTVCSEKQCDSSYDDDNATNKSTCNLVCYNKLEVSLPGKPDGTFQIGQHFVWPNNNSGNGFSYKPLSSSTTKVCRIMTNKVLSDNDKTLCQEYFENKDLDSETNIQLSIVYENDPFKGNSTELSGDNDSENVVTTDEYNVQFNNSKLNKKSAVQYTVNLKNSYSLPSNYYAYSPKSKLLLPTSYATDLTKYVDIGYGNLPISWLWKHGDEKKVGISIVASVDNKSINYVYECKFEPTDFDKRENVCPQYSKKPGESPTGFEECLNSNSYGNCIKNFCYDGGNDNLYCPNDCQQGVCKTSDDTLKLRECMNSGNNKSFFECVTSSCEINKPAIYRTISLVNPFPGKDGTGRIKGYNWNNDDLVTKYITDTQDYYNKTPMYEITLGPSEISKIRAYNKASVAGYLNDTLTCTSGLGINCRSSFITQFKSIFNSNTCGMSNDWNACDSR